MCVYAIVFPRQFVEGQCSWPKLKMRFMHFLTLVVPTSAAGTCGVGSVDLSGVGAISVSINCPSNKNDEGIELGCVEKLRKTAKGKEVKQRSNTFFVQPCGAYKSSEQKCQELKFDSAAGYQVTEDNEPDGTITKTCFSIGSSKEPKFSLLGKHTIFF